MTKNKNNLLATLEGSTRFVDMDFFEEFLEEEEVDASSFYQNLCNQIQECTEDLWESAAESFHSQIDRWYRRGDYIDYSFPSCVNKEEIAYLIVKSVRQRISQASEDYEWS